LLACADLAGGDWPERARTAAVKFNQERAGVDVSLGVRLLSDLRDIWPAGAEHVSTTTLLETLNDLVESPWGDLHGRPLDARGLARRLRAYGVKPRDVRLGVGGLKAKGYSRADLWDVWARYLPPLAKDGRQGRQPGQDADAEYDGVLPVADSVADVADASPNVADREPGFEFDVASVADVAHSTLRETDAGVLI
jgi:hypothetical protein